MAGTFEVDGATDAVLVVCVCDEAALAGGLAVILTEDVSDGVGVSEVADGASSTEAADRTDVPIGSAAVADAIESTPDVVGRGTAAVGPGVLDTGDAEAVIAPLTAGPPDTATLADASEALDASAAALPESVVSVAEQPALVRSTVQLSPRKRSGPARTRVKLERLVISLILPGSTLRAVSVEVPISDVYLPLSQNWRSRRSALRARLP